MKDVELYGRVRYAVRIEGLSERAAARRFGIDPRTVSKMIKFSGPPGYVRKKPPAKPKLDPFIPVIDRILRDARPSCMRSGPFAENMHISATGYPSCDHAEAETGFLDSRPISDNTRRL
jgi:hypothetical protein